MAEKRKKASYISIMPHPKLPREPHVSMSGALYIHMSMKRCGHAHFYVEIFTGNTANLSPMAARACRAPLQPFRSQHHLLVGQMTRTADASLGERNTEAGMLTKSACSGFKAHCFATPPSPVSKPVGQCQHLVHRYKHQR